MTKRIAWTPLAPFAAPRLPEHEFLAALQAFWRRTERALEQALPNYPERVAELPSLPRELETLLRAPLDVAQVRALHEFVTREQAAVPARLKDGSWRQIAMPRGQFKGLPNELAMRDGAVREFCPPERVEEQLTRLLAAYHALPAEDLQRRSAWLVLGVLNVHPFVDGNGRLARALGNADFLRAGLPPPWPSVDTRGDGYREALDDALLTGAPTLLEELLATDAGAAVYHRLRAAELEPSPRALGQVVAERAAVASLREQLAEDHARQAARLPGLARVLGEVLEGLPARVIWRCQQGKIGQEVVQRLTAAGLPVRPGVPAVALELEVEGLLSRIDLVALGAFGVGAWLAVASIGAQRLRGRSGRLLLVATETEEGQAARLAAWATRAVVASQLHGVGYGS